MAEMHGMGEKNPNLHIESANYASFDCNVPITSRITLLVTGRAGFQREKQGVGGGSHGQRREQEVLLVLVRHFGSVPRQRFVEVIFFQKKSERMN